MMPIAVVEDGATSARAKTGSKQIGSEQGFLEGAGFTMMDSNRHLRCLSLKSTLKFAAMSSSSPSSKAMGGTTISTPVFGSVLVAEEDEYGEEDEADGEDGDTDGRVLAL